MLFLCANNPRFAILKSSNKNWTINYYLAIAQFKMDYSPPEKHRKKKDKARQKKDRFGTKTTKHVRQLEGMLEKQPPKPKAKSN
jgi:hypothetical protein